MELRRILLRTLLIALALAALAGVLGVITAAGEVIWRIVATAIATAVAVGIMLPFSRMIDKRTSRPGGLAGLVWTLGAWLMVVALTWGMLPGRQEEALAMTLLSWSICGLPAVLFLSFAAMPQARLATRAGITICAAVFCLLLVGAWEDGLWSYPHEWWDAGWALGGIGLLAIVNLVHAGTGDGRWWRWIGVTAAAAAWVIAEVGIIRQTDSLAGRVVLTSLIGLAGVVGLANLAALAPLVGGQVWVRIGTVIAAAACALAVDLLVFDEHGYSADVWGRLAAGAGIVAGCGSLALLVLARINRRVEYQPEEGSVLVGEIGIICPRCSKSQTIPLGGAACSACGLRIEVTIEEPRCPKCGYLVYLLQSPVCPECGTTLASPDPATKGPA